MKRLVTRSTLAISCLLGVLGLGAAPAYASPSGINYYGQCNGDNPNSSTCEGVAYFTSGTGEIRAVLECYSGGQYWSVEGPWEPINTYSVTPACPYSPYDDASYQTES